MLVPLERLQRLRVVLVPLEHLETALCTSRCTISSRWGQFPGLMGMPHSSPLFALDDHGSALRTTDLDLDDHGSAL